MPTDEAAEVDLTNVRTLLSQAMSVARDLDGLTPPAGNNPQRASVKRDLLYLADTADRAASEARAVYHVLNGNPDPLEGP